MIDTVFMCPGCQLLLSADQGKFCPRCGAQLYDGHPKADAFAEEQKWNPPYSVGFAWVLAIFGFNGFVQAYNGQRTKGWLLFITQFLCYVVWRYESYPNEPTIDSLWVGPIVLLYIVNLIDGLITAYRIRDGKPVSHN